jgi:hypothetical protein
MTLLKKHERIAQKGLLAADERGFRTVGVLFSIRVHQRSSAANLVFGVSL